MCTRNMALYGSHGSVSAGSECQVDILYIYGVLADWSKEGGKRTSVYIKW